MSRGVAAPIKITLSPSSKVVKPDGINNSLFSGNPTKKELELATRILRGEYYHPATNSLWFYNPGTNKPCPSLWYDQRNAGKYKSHCFYIPYPGVCRQLH